MTAARHPSPREFEGISILGDIASEIAALDYAVIAGVLTAHERSARLAQLQKQQIDIKQQHFH